MDISYQFTPKLVHKFSIKRSLTTTKNLISCRVRAQTLGAQGTTSTPNLYQVLSLESEKVGFEEIKKAYRTMARQYHPDVAPASKREDSTKKFVELQKAYETLSDPTLRQNYDYKLGYLSCSGEIRTQNEEWGVNMSKKAWEDQLSGLEMRSSNKVARKRNPYR